MGGDARHTTLFAANKIGARHPSRVESKWFRRELDNGPWRGEVYRQGCPASASASCGERLTAGRLNRHNAVPAHRGVPGLTLCLRCPPGCAWLTAQCQTGQPSNQRGHGAWLSFRREMVPGTAPIALMVARSRAIGGVAVFQ
jgi:hypothetical protein